MRATRRITWLLLSLSFLCHSGSSDDTAGVTTAVAKVTPAPTAAKPGTEAPTTTEATVPARGGTVTTPAGAEKKTQAPTTVRPPAKASTPAPTKPADSFKPADKPTPTQPPASTAANGSTAPPTSIPHTAAKATAADSTTPAAPAVPTAAPDSGGVSPAAPHASTLQASHPSAPSKTPTAKTPSGPPAQGASESTTRITKASTDAPTPDHRSGTPTTTNSKMSQEVSKGGTQVAHVTAASPGQTPSKAPQPAGTASTPPAPTGTGPPAVAQTSGSNGGSVTPQATVTTAASVTTTASIATGAAAATTTATAGAAASSSSSSTAAQPNTFLYSLNRGQETEEEELAEVCRRLMVNLHDGNCTLTWRHHSGKLQFDNVEINGKVKTSLANQYYEEITKKPTDNKTLIAILASCGALLIMIVILAVCASHHRKPYNENQQHLTEELHTVENGYHDNPTLEVMEVQPEMQEKKMALNGEFNDSWIVPIDNLLKEDIPDEEDTHL